MCIFITVVLSGLSLALSNFGYVGGLLKGAKIYRWHTFCWDMTKWSLDRWFLNAGVGFILYVLCVGDHLRSDEFMLSGWIQAFRNQS